MQSGTAAKSMHRVPGMVVVTLCCFTVGLCELKNLIGVTALTSKAVCSLPCRTIVLQRACTGSQGWLL